MNITDALQMCPHLASPAALARTDTYGKFQLPPHLALINRELAAVPFTDNARLMINCPFQFGKSTISSHFFPAWYLLLFPETRIILVANTDTLASSFGSKVKDTIDKFGGPLGIHLKKDTKAKDEWVIGKHGGGMVCRGVGGSLLGRPADCVRGDTLLTTTAGKMRIDYFCTLRNRPLVLSYSHSAQRTEWKPVVATRMSHVKRIVEVRTGEGDSLFCTGEHRLCVEGHGYRNAVDLRRGDILLKENMPRLRVGEGEARETVREMLVAGEVGQRFNGMWVMQSANAGRLARCSKGFEKGIQEILFRQLHEKELLQEVRKMRSANGEENVTILQAVPSKSLGKFSHSKREAMRFLREDIPASIIPPTALFQRVCRRNSLSKNDWSGEFPLQNRRKLRRVVSPDAASYFGERFSQVPYLSSNRKKDETEGAAWFCYEKQYLHPPHQWNGEGQSAREFGVPVQLLSRGRPQVEVSHQPVHMVEQLCVDGVDVYDLQVEGNGNFFANGLLVHNCLLLDDLIRDAEEAMSPTIMEKHWDWYTTSAYSRLGPTAGIVNVGTRWGTRDIFGRALAESRKTGETWRHIKIKAIAGKDDILGRKPGEGLWNERVPLERLQRIAAARGKWFDICWQQEPIDEEGGHFRPQTWPLYDDMGDAWSVQEDAATGRRRTIVMKNEVVILVTVDWATSERKTSDYTAMGVFAVLPDGRILILDMVNERLRLEQCVPRLASLCRLWRPHQVAVEAFGFQAALANECRRFPEIPEPRRLQPESKANAKLRRALPAIVMGENRRLLLPSKATETLSRVAGSPESYWSAEFVAQLQAFTGIDDDHDDMVDTLAYACQVAQQLRPHFHDGFDAGPCVLTAGRGF